MMRDSALANVFHHLFFEAVGGLDQLENRARVGCAEERNVLLHAEPHRDVILGREIFDLGNFMRNRAAALDPRRTGAIDQRRG